MRIPGTLNQHMAIVAQPMALDLGLPLEPVANPRRIAKESCILLLLGKGSEERSAWIANRQERLFAVQNRRVRTGAVIGPNHGTSAQIDLGRLCKSRMRVGIKIPIRKKSEGKLVGMEFQDVPRWIRRAGDLGSPNGICQFWRQAAVRGTQHVQRRWQAFAVRQLRHSFSKCFAIHGTYRGPKFAEDQPVPKSYGVKAPTTEASAE